jgi:hypothetical protein
MKVDVARKTDASEPDAQGRYEYYYEYDIYTFCEGDDVLLARSYIHEPQKASFYSWHSGGRRHFLTVADLQMPLFQAAEIWLRAAGKTSIQWLSHQHGGYLETKNFT